MSQTIRGCISRLNRAEEHAGTLRKSFEAFVSKPENREITFEQDINTVNQFMYGQLRKAPPTTD